jgi:hypothetical protein
MIVKTVVLLAALAPVACAGNRGPRIGTSRPVGCGPGGGVPAASGTRYAKRWRRAVRSVCPATPTVPRTTVRDHDAWTCALREHRREFARRGWPRAG